MPEAAVDLAAVKAGQRKTWSAGDFARVALAVYPVSELLMESAEVIPGEQVLDVACGSGNTAIAAARRFGDVTGVDYVPALLEHARERAKAELVEIEFVEGDAENLPFPDASFDLVTSSFGVMFTADHRRAASELVRVCRPGGRIALANWTPDGYIGEMFAIIGRHAPPPAGVQPPPRWGTEEYVRELLGDGISGLEASRHDHSSRYPSAEFALDYYRKWYGPTQMAFARLDDAGQRALADELLELARLRNMAGDMAQVAPWTYLEVIATRAG